MKPNALAVGHVWMYAQASVLLLRIISPRSLTLMRASNVKVVWKIVLKKRLSLSSQIDPAFI